MDWTWGWTAVGAICTGILAIGIWFAFLQVRQTKRSTQAQIAVELFQELRSAQVLETLRFIYRLKPEDIQNMHAIDKNNIGSVLDKFELLGALVAQGIIDERIAIEAYGGPPVLKCWYQLGENYIKKVREQRGLFCKYVEDFAARTFDYQRRRLHKKDEWIQFYGKEGDEPINLVEEFIKNSELRPKRQK